MNEHIDSQSARIQELEGLLAQKDVRIAALEEKLAVYEGAGEDDGVVVGESDEFSCSVHR